jgi:ubiquitin-conjugating enzyme E2 W
MRGLRWLAPLLLASIDAGVLTRPMYSTAREQMPASRRRAAVALTLHPLLLLRGGADDTLPEPVADAGASSDESDAEAPLDLKAACAKQGVGAAQEATCWTVLSQLLQAVKSLFSPTYAYAKKDTDILGDAKQQSGFEEDDESWRTQRKKLNQVELSAAVQKRVLRDLRILKREVDLGLEVEDCECLTDWVVKMIGAKGTVYEGEIYRLRVRIHADYPTQPPEVTFMRPAPVHEHIYSDGKICLNILYSDWEPKMDVKSLCLSLLSMLSSAKKKSRPPDNDSTVVMSQGQKTRNMQWEFHDDNC